MRELPPFEDRSDLASAQRFAVAFQRKGIVAFHGIHWDDASRVGRGHNVYWFFCPRASGGVMAINDYDGHTNSHELWQCTSDVWFIEPAHVDYVLNRVLALHKNPTRDELVKAIMQGAQDAKG